jgi:hypothetical protein
MHIPSYSVPLLIDKNKEIKGHFNGPLPEEYDSTDICIFRDILVLPHHVLSATTGVLVTKLGRQHILILLVRNYEVGSLESCGWGILSGSTFKYYAAHTKFREWYSAGTREIWNDNHSQGDDTVSLIFEC